MAEIIAFWTLLALSGAAAAWRGGRTERIGVALLAADWAAARLIGPREWWLMGLDIVVVAVLARLAWRSPRTWPIWALACQAVAAAASLAYGLQPDVGEATWLRALALAGLGPPLALAASLWRPHTQA